MKKKKITKIEALSKLPKKTRVAAYARVSNGKDTMLHSLSAQINYYKKMIQDNNDWQFAGVYADEALTGTKDSREEFQQLLEDSKAGKIDMIITKSISRFARNTVTLLKTVRELDKLNVDVFFEEQNIHSISSEGEMVLTLLASVAQEESRSVSENMKWRIKKEFEQGEIWGGRSPLGYSLKNKTFRVIPEEAEVVQLIYKLYVDGNGAEAICQILDAKGIKPKESKKWGPTSIIKILSNRNYTGDLLLQKTYLNNHLSKKQVINKGELDRYLVKGNHEAIISNELFDKVQKLKQKRAIKNKSNLPKKKTFLHGLIQCGNCGSTYTPKKMRQKDIWICSKSASKGQDVCDSKLVPHNIIVEASKRVLDMDQYIETIFNSKVTKIIVQANKVLEFHMKDGAVVSYRWKNKSRSKSWTPEMKEQARLRALKQHHGGRENG
jgi:DNA invertase Pin-like site-specific DNA recombinase